MKMLLTALLSCAVATSPLPAGAVDLTIGRATEHQALDPHFSQTGPNTMTAMAMFARPAR